VLNIQTNPIEAGKLKILDLTFKNAVWDLENNLPIINTYVNLKNTNKLSLIKSKTINAKFSDLDLLFNNSN